MILKIVVDSLQKGLVSYAIEIEGEYVKEKDRMRKGIEGTLKENK